MAIQSQPSRISEPFAGSGSKNAIPATNATPSASQAASWASGFPPECSQPISAGGCPVPRNDVNGVLNQLSQDYAFRQDGGIWAWSSQADYDAQRLVRGSDGLLYYSKAQTGPNTANGTQDPVTDAAGTYWTSIPVDNSNVVHKTGLENITGTKTLAGANLHFLDAAGLHMMIVSTDDDSLNSGLYDYNYSKWLIWSTYQGDVNLPTDVQVFSDAPRFILHEEDLDVTNITAAGKASILFQDKNKVTCTSVSSRVTTAGASAVGFFATEHQTSNTYGVELLVTPSNQYFLPSDPANDGLVNLGGGGNRWNTVYAATGTISTSDERLKDNIDAVPDEVLDAWSEIGFCQFRFRDSVASKGEDARLHSGLIAQRIDEAFKAHGLDASQYGLFCHDEWGAQEEQKDEDGSLVTPAREAGDRYALRYDEALCMEAAYQRRRADRAEARLVALEERLAAIEAKLG